MGTYRHSSRPEMPSFSRRVRGPAAWGGIGCMLAVLLPVLSYFAALLTLDYNAFYRWFDVPAQWAARPMGLPISIIIIILTVGYTIFLYAIYSTIYAIVYRVAGITPYTVLDLEYPPKTRKRISQLESGKLANILIFLAALAGGIGLVHLNAAKGWLPFPPSWLLPGPAPYAGVDVLVVLLLWVSLWALWGIIQAIISATLKKESPDDSLGDEF